jgi:hypothetical protein
MRRIFNARQFGVLLAAGLRLTLTGGRGADAGSGGDGSRHLLGAAYGLTLSTVMAWILFKNASPGQFLLVTMTLSMIFTATSVIAELAGGLFQPLDLAVTGHLPVPAFTRFAARLTELLSTLLILTLNLNLTPAIFLFFMTGNNPAAPAIALACGFGAAVFTAAACLVLYAVLARFLSATQFQGTILYLNIFVSMAILGLLVNTGRLLQSDALRASAEGDWPLHFPPAWFAGLAVTSLGLSSGGSETAVAAILALCTAVLPLLLAALGSENLVRTMAGERTARRGKSAPGLLMRGFDYLFVRAEEKAAFEFTAVNLARDRGFRMKAYPIVGIPVFMICMSLFEKRDPLFFILMLHLMNLYMPLVISFMPYGDYHLGAWIFDALPVRGSAHFARGAEKAFIFRLALPVFILNTAVLSLVWTPLEGGLNALYAFLAGLFVIGVGMRQTAAYPFSREFRGAVTQTFGGLVGAAFLILFVAASIQYLSRGTLLVFSAQILAMAIIHKVRFTLPVRPRENGNRLPGEARSP